MRSFLHIYSLAFALFFSVITVVPAQNVVTDAIYVGNSDFDFTLETEGSKVLLSWEVETKENIKSFTIERSFDSDYFVPIYQTYYLKGSSDYVDYLLGNEQQQEVLYYRLIVEYQNGNEVETTVKQINLLEGKNLKPTIYTKSGMVEFDFYVQNAENVAMQVFNTTGSPVLDKIIPTKKGSNKEALNVHNLRSGMYFLRLEQGGIVTTTKFYIR